MTPLAQYRRVERWPVRLSVNWDDHLCAWFHVYVSPHACFYPVHNWGIESCRMAVMMSDKEQPDEDELIQVYAAFRRWFNIRVKSFKVEKMSR